jgi:predicted nuclease with TOPRIM domain
VPEPELIVEVTVSQLEWLRERIGELEAEVARLKAEMDNMAADHHVIHVRTSHFQQAMEVCRDEEPGTIMRETDGLRRDYVLGKDRTWTAR